MAQRPEVIAEAGSNHNGDPERARQLVDVAVESGASSVKFQFIFADGLYLPEFFDGERKVRNPVFDQRKKEELTETEWSSIWEYAHGKGIPVSASVFCERGVQLLYRLGSPYVKIASTDLTNHNLIGKACQCFQRVIVSTGMASLSEIDGMVAFVRESYPETDLQLMHCVSSYPCPLNEANTQRVSLLRHSFDLCVGYSDHTEGTESAVMALVQGATFFEKHFTVDRNQPGFDHAHAMESAELMNYVRTLADSMISLEKPANQSSSEELVSKIRARRGIYAAKDLPAGHILTKEDLLFVRPSSSFSGKDVSLLVGKALAQDVPQYAALGEGGQAMVVESNWRDASAYWKNEMDAKNM